MRNYNIYIFLLAALVAGGCSQKYVVTPHECDITLSASVVEVQTVTKGSSAYQGDVPSGDNPLTADLWFSLIPGNYSILSPTDENTQLPCHTYNTFDSGNHLPIFYDGMSDKPLKYPTSGSPVYCIGLYPQGVWSYDKGSFVAGIDGHHDLMIAPEVSGKWNNQFCTTESNSLKFQHILTWIKVVLCATSYDAIDTWGKITDVTMKDVPTHVSITNKVPLYSGEKDIQLLSQPTELLVTNTDAGEFLCAPMETYTFNIKSTDGKTATKTVGPDNGFQAGSQYVVVLYFNSLTDIDGICTLSPWENQNDNLYLK